MLIGLLQVVLLIMIFIFFTFIDKNQIDLTILIINMIIIFTSVILSVIFTNTTKINLYQKKINYILQPFIKAFILSFIFTYLISIIIDIDLIARSTQTIILTYAVIMMFIAIKCTKEPLYKVHNDYELIHTNLDQRELKGRGIVQIEGLYDGNKIKEKFDFGSFIKYGKKYDKDLLYIGENFDIQISGPNNHQSKILITNLLNRNKFNAQLKKCFDKIIDGGLFIFNLSNLKLNPVEVKGRLMYYGFEEIGHTNYNDLTYIVARKVYEPYDVGTPSDNFIISLDRVGLFGHNIKIHKIRSMFPYSEFLQKKIMIKKNISSIGKIDEDPRITPFGKFIRKYWLDELPQVYDWLRGEIKLVGIRALSYPFFEKYPDRYKKKYFSVKPGFICPIFDETINGFDEIIKIEEKYLDDYLKNPVVTDFKLFFRTLKMIFKGTRST